MPPTPGQPLKEPMFIPVAVGLLDSSGKDMPLSALYHDGKLESVASNNQPVYNTVLKITKVSSESLWSPFSPLLVLTLDICDEYQSPLAASQQRVGL